MGLSIALILLLAFLFKDGCQKPVQLQTKTDTIYRDRFIPDTSKNGRLLLPITIYKYQEKIKYINKITHDTVNISTIDSFPVWVRDTLFTQAPSRIDWRKTNHLIQGKFYRDSLALSLIDSSGEITKYVYKTEYDNFRYEFFNDGSRLKMNSISTTKLNLHKLFKPVFSSYVYLTYSPFYSTGIKTSVDYYLDFNRVGIGGMTSISNLESPHVITYFGVRYKLK